MSYRTRKCQHPVYCNCWFLVSGLRRNVVMRFVQYIPDNKLCLQILALSTEGMNPMDKLPDEPIYCRISCLSRMSRGFCVPCHTSPVSALISRS